MVATLDVVTGFGGNVLATRQVRRSDFTAANQWQTFTLQFDNPCFGLFEARVWWAGNASMKFAQLTITPLSVASSGVQWLVTDQLGTPRMVFDKTGSLSGVSRHDYLPFGEELYAGVGGRTAQEGYTADNTRQHFTGYEADGETGLNFAQARYQSPVQGRFTSVDPLMASATVFDPQSLNRYSYVQNNPTNFTDPTGMSLADIGVYQTEDAEEAKTLTRKSDADQKRAINGEYAHEHGGTVSYDKEGHATFIGKGSAVHYFRRLLTGGSGRAGGNVTVSAEITTPEAKLYGPFVINLPSADNNEKALRDWIDKYPKGVPSGTWCAEFVQFLADSFGNSQGRSLGLAGGGRWRAGAQVDENTPRGTVIISGIKQYSAGGLVFYYYPNYQDMGNHAATLLSHLPGGGIRVFEQIHGNIQIRPVAAGEGGSYFSNARAYYVLMVGPAVPGIPNRPYYPK